MGWRAIAATLLGIGLVVMLTIMVRRGQEQGRTRALFVIFLVCDCIGESLCVVNQINIMCRELDLCFLTCVMCDGHVR